MNEKKSFKPFKMFNPFKLLEGKFMI